MKRKMVYIGLSYVSGLFFASFLSDAFFIGMLFLAAAAVILALAGIKIRELAVCGVVFLLAVTVYMSYDSLVYRKILSYKGQNISLSGRVIEVNSHADDKSTYLIEGKINGSQNARVLCYLESANCRYGDKITVEGTFKGFENNYLFNAEDYYKARNIFLQLENAESFTIESADGFALIRGVAEYRIKAERMIKEVLPKDEGDFLTAMLLGDRSGLSDETEDFLYRSGIGHVMAVSGLHLMIISTLFMWLLNLLGVGRRTSFFIVEALIVIFVLFTGAGISVIRAAVMITIINGAVLFGRQGDTLNSLCIAMLGLTVFSPFMIQSASLILSCSGVFGIGVLAPYITSGIKNKSGKAIASMLCVSMAVFPASVMFFEEASVITPLTNIFLLPLCMIALVFGFITLLTGGLLAYPLLLVSGVCIKAVLAVTKWLGRLEYTHISLGRSDLPIIIAVISVFILLTYAIFRKPKALAAAISLSVALLMSNCVIHKLLNRDILSAAVLGKGTDAAVVIKRGNSADIIDLCGGRRTSAYVEKYLSSVGISKINNLIIADNQYQSIASYDNALALYSVGNVILPNGTVIEKNTQICGCIPEYDAFADISLSYKAYEIKLSDGVLNIYNDEFSMACFTGSHDFADRAYSVAVRYGESAAATVNSGYYITLENGIENNIEIRTNGINLQTRRLTDGIG